MFRKFMLLAGVVGMITAACADTIIPGGNVSGIWAAAGSPFLIMGEITVPSGQTLNIEPGVQVIFQGHYQFKVLENATLRAVGTQQDSILFTAANPSTGWYGIRFHYASDSSRLQFCHLENGLANGPLTPSDYLEAGGAVLCVDSSPTIQNCLIDHCVAHLFGGGIHCVRSHPTIENCQITDNHVVLSGVANYGGAICLSDTSNSLIRGNLITLNSSGRGGGIACLDHCSPIIEKNLILGNSADYWGGGIYCVESSNPEITSNTLVNNSAQYGGAFFADNSEPVITNSIAWGNTPYQLEGDWIVTYSCLQGGYQGIGNINANPLFVTGPDGNYYLSQIAAGQSQNSPCVDAGDPNSPMIEGTTRTDGVQDQSVVDMGFHYTAFPPPPIDIALTPSNPPIVIPAGGGWFAFVVTIDNNTDSTQTFDGWTLVQLPNGIQFPLIPPISITLPANASLFRAKDQYVPSTAPAGNYLYRGFVGDHPWTIADSSSFPFTKLGANRDWLGAEGWISSGEPFPGENVTAGEIHPSSFLLHPCSPNPFNPITVISYRLSGNSFVSLQVYDTAGRLVATLVDGWREAGAHEVTFDGTGLAAGIYFARLEAGEYVGVEKMVMLK